MDVIRHVNISGRVQGIGYRAWTEYTALERGIQGWVRNRRDGSVEALFAGPAEAVAAMIEQCRQGPPGARIDAIDQREAGSEELALRRRGELFSVLAPPERRRRRRTALEFAPQGHVHFRRRYRHAEVGERSDAVAPIGDAARHDAGKMREVGFDIERETMQRHPALHADADGRDLVFKTVALSGRRTQTPMRSSRRSPRTLMAASVRMIHSSTVTTKRRTSGARRLRSSMT